MADAVPSNTSPRSSKLCCSDTAKGDAAGTAMGIDDGAIATTRLLEPHEQQNVLASLGPDARKPSAEPITRRPATLRMRSREKTGRSAAFSATAAAQSIYQTKNDKTRPHRRE